MTSSHSCLLVVGVWACGCLGPEPAVGGGSTSITHMDPTGSSTATTPTSTTTAVLTSGSMTADGGSSGTSTTTSGSSSSDEGVDGDHGAKNGAACIDPVFDCLSGNCFVIGPLGGVCSECDESADCKPVPGFGCNPGNPLTGVPAVCSRTGEVGEGCETIDDCAPGRFCPIVIEVPGIVSVASCSECEGDMGCAGGRICAPSYDIAALRGYYACADPGSVPDAEGCNLDGDGSECASGECAPAALDGITFVAVCSPCNGPGDCGGGLACQLPEVMLDGAGLSIVPGACV